MFNLKASYYSDYNKAYLFRIFLFHFYDNYNLLYTRRLAQFYINRKVIYRRISDITFKYIKDYNQNINYVHFNCLLSSLYTHSQQKIVYVLQLPKSYNDNIRICEYYKNQSREYLHDSLISFLYPRKSNMYKGIYIDEEETQRVINTFNIIMDSYKLLDNL